MWVGLVAENGLEKEKGEDEGNDGDGVEGRMAAGEYWLVNVTMGKKYWTCWCIGLAANANSQEPMGEEIWQGSVVLVARMGRVALTDYRRGEPGGGLSENVVTRPRGSRDRRESAVQTQMHETHH
jgi:hypothetical protein